jgi:DNA repair protein RadC
MKKETLYKQAEAFTEKEILFLNRQLNGLKDELDKELANKKSMLDLMDTLKKFSSEDGFAVIGVREVGKDKELDINSFEEKAKEYLKTFEENLEILTSISNKFNDLAKLFDNK